MPNVIVDVTMSLDGFVTGEHADEQQELGDPPEPTWEHAAGCGDTEILEHATRRERCGGEGATFQRGIPNRRAGRLAAAGPCTFGRARTRPSPVVLAPVAAQAGFAARTRGKRPADVGGHRCHLLFLDLGRVAAWWKKCPRAPRRSAPRR
jgi:hypothetical protein